MFLFFFTSSTIYICCLRLVLVAVRSCACSTSNAMQRIQQKNKNHDIHDGKSTAEQTIIMSLSGDEGILCRESQKQKQKKKKHKMKMWEDWHYRNWFWLATRSDIQYSHMLHWPNIVIALTSTTTSILWLSPSKKKNTNFSADNLVDRIDNSIWCQSYVWRWYFEPINANFEVRIELECNGDTRVGRA